jgi:dipeptidyl-peptidase-4
MRTPLLCLAASALGLACATPHAAAPPVPTPVTAPAPAAPATPAAGPARAEIRDVTDDDVAFLTRLVTTRGFSLGAAMAPRFLSDGSKLLYLRAAGPEKPDLGLYVFDLASGETRELITPEQVLKGAEEKLSPEEKARRERMRANKLRGFAGFQVSRDDRSVLLALSGRIFVVSIDGKSVVEVAGPDAAGKAPFDHRFSPDGKSVSFVRAGELWVVPATGGAARQLTKGAGGTVFHAQAEFVAQEEMGRFTGYWWSPDSRAIAYQIHDEKDVQTLRPVDPADPYADAPAVRYPRPGTPNVSVRLAVVPAAGGKPTFVEWDHARYEYLWDVRWDEGGPLALLVFSRDQKDLALLAADPKTGATRELVREHDDAWLEEPTCVFLDDGTFVWSSDRGGRWQLELRGKDGALVRTLTPPELNAQKLAHIDEAGRRLIVAAAPEPVDGHLYAVSLDGGAPALLSDPAVVTGAVYAERSGAHVRYVVTDDHDVPAQIIRADGSVAGTLPEPFVKAPFEAWPVVRKVGPGEGFWTATIRPRDFDPQKKYPVLVDVYGGPGVRVVRRGSDGPLSQWIADHGFIVVSIDGRGTPGRGRAWERAIKHAFAEVPLADQVAGLQALAAVEPAMDLERVGIFGWSFGGYMAALAVLRRSDVFKAAVAGAPVADWLDYDTTYTERYLGVPDLQGDRKIYDDNGLAAYAKGLASPLLVVHGTADDNVHFSHALTLATALFDAGKSFELLPLAGETHAPRRPDRMARYYERMFHFFREHL